MCVRLAQFEHLRTLLVFKSIELKFSKNNIN
jgi:hypothetical protein